MKKLLFIAVFISISIFSSVSIGMNNDKHIPIDFAEQTIEDDTNNNNSAAALKDCTVRLDFELADGTTIQGEITFVDVTWWDCTKMKFAAWWARTF